MVDTVLHGKERNMKTKARKAIIKKYGVWQGIGGINNKVSTPVRRATIYIN